MTQTTALPISVIVPSAGRIDRLVKTLTSLRDQSAPVRQLVLVVADTPSQFNDVVETIFAGSDTQVRFQIASEKGAAAQRNQAFALSTEPIIMFLDDDVDLDVDCVLELHRALTTDPKAGGVTASITNQTYRKPRLLSRHVYSFLGFPFTGTLAGLCRGPAINFLPAPPSTSSISCSNVEWLNTTCTLYRRESLPNPLFPPIFTGYSLMEDLALSLIVAKNWRLLVAHTAHIFHDSTPAAYKSNMKIRETMEVENRYFVMTQIMGSINWLSKFRFIAFEFFSCASLLYSRTSGQDILATILVKLKATYCVIRSTCNPCHARGHRGL